MRKLSQFLLVALLSTLTACGGRQTVKVTPPPAAAQAPPPAVIAVAPKPEEPLDVRDDEVVWGTSEESVELASESEGDELSEPTAALNGEAAVVSESDDTSPAAVSAAPTQEGRSRPRMASGVSDAPPALPDGTDDNGGSDVEAAGVVSPASPSAGGGEARVEERNSPAVAENGSYYGEVSPATGRPKTVHVRGYYRKDGTYVRGHYRSAPRRRN